MIKQILVKRILVLGAEGFIGNHLIGYLATLGGYEIWGIDVLEYRSNLYHYEKISLLSSDFDDFLSKNSFDIIFNCAGSGNVAFSVQYPMSDFEYNCRAVVHLLEAIRKHQPYIKLVHLSSAAVYGNPVTLPISESDNINPLSPYGYHKWMAEISCREYAMLYNLNIDIIRPFSVYGPGLKKQLLWDIFTRSKTPNEIILWGTGDETRDFMYVEDLVAAIVAIANNQSRALTTFNVAVGNTITVREIAEQLLGYLHCKNRLVFNNQVRVGDPRFWQADISSLNSIGFKPSISMEEGLRRTAEWMLSHDKA